MRKAVVEIVPNRLVKGMWGSFFDTVDHLEGREILQLNFEKGVKLVIVDIITREGYTIDDVKLPSATKIINLLKREGNRYTVLLKAVVLGKPLGNFMKLFDLDLIYDLPYYADREHFKLSCIGESGSIKKLVTMLGLLGEVRTVSFTKATFNVLNVLTEKQKEIMIEANRLGYYRYPRKVNAGQLSERLGISKATTVEHLRKAEMRIISDLLEGY
ncbi:MAG: helix-turn-helix domain-containing protein [Thermoplasmatota archaeon]